MRSLFWLLCVGMLSSQASYAASVDKSVAKGKKLILLITPAEAQKIKKGDTITLGNKKLGIEVKGTVTKVSAKKAMIDLEEASAFKAGTRLEIIASRASGSFANESAETARPSSSGSSHSEAVPEPAYPYAPNFLSISNLPADRQTALPFLSPASLFKTRKPTADLGFRFLQWEAKDKSDLETGSGKTKIEGQDFELFTGFPIPNTKLNLGFRYVQNTNKLKVDSFKATYDVTIYGPIVSYLVTPNLSLGAQYDFTKYTIKASDIKLETTVNIFRPGLTFFKPGLEVEVFYSPPINVKEKDELAQEPGTVMINGRFGPRQKIIAVQVRRINFSAIDEDSKDIFALRVGTESTRADLTTFGGYVNYRQEAFDGEENAVSSSLQRFGLEGFLQQEIQPQARAGVHFSYEYAPEKKTEKTLGRTTSTTKHSLSGFYIGLNGAMAF